MNKDTVRLAAFRLQAGIVYALPRRVSYRLARAGGGALSLLPTRRRAALRSNIAAVYGTGVGDRGVRRDTRRAFQHALLNYVDMFLLSRPDTSRLVARLSVANLDLLLEMLARGKGVILVSAHYGNVDTVVQWLGVYGFPTLIPVEAIEPPALRDAVIGLRGAFALRFQAVGPDTYAKLAAALRAGEIVVLVCDRDIQGTGQHVTLFGRDVTLPSAAVLLALRTGAPVLSAFGTRHPDNSVSAELAGPLPIASSGKGRFRLDLAHGMAVLAGVLEAQIRRDPGQWVVQQPLFEPSSWDGRGIRGVDGVARAVRRLAGRIRLARRGAESGPSVCPARSGSATTVLERSL